MLVGESILAGSTLLICAVFVYVWRKSAAVYLAIWGLASTFNAWFPDPRLNIAAVLALLLAARPPASRSEWKVAIPIVAFPFIIPQRFAAVNLVAVYVLAFLVFRDWLPRIVLAALVMGALLWLTAGLLPSEAHGLIRFIALGSQIGAGIVVYGLLLQILRVASWREAAGALKRPTQPDPGA